MISPAPLPDNELDRLLSLSSLDLNYQNLNDSFADLARLAAGIAGTSISLVNLVDAYTQWSIATHGLDIEQMPRQDSVCQYTILEDNFLEVSNLTSDERFSQKDYVVGDPNLVYYFGVPLKTDDGQNIGALCVLDRNAKAMNGEKLELLKIIAREIVVRLQAKKMEEELRLSLAELRDTQKKLAHDIRGPIAGIVGLGRLFKNKTFDSEPAKLQEVFSMIEDGGESVLGLAEEILKGNKINKEAEQMARESQYNLPQFKEAIEKLYRPLSKAKDIQFQVWTGLSNLNTFFSRKLLMQISGNLLSNAIKFTPAGGSITVELLLEMYDGESLLKISVQDSGVGIPPQKLAELRQGLAFTTRGTQGENGYGLGLCLVSKLVSQLGGSLEIDSTLEKGTRFSIAVPQQNNTPEMIALEKAMSLVA